MGTLSLDASLIGVTHHLWAEGCKLTAKLSARGCSEPSLGTAERQPARGP